MYLFKKLFLSLGLIATFQIIVTTQFSSIIRNGDDDFQIDEYHPVVPKNIFPNFNFLEEPLPTYAETIRSYRNRALLYRLIKMRLKKLKELGVIFNIQRLRNLIQKEIELGIDPEFRKNFFDKNYNNFEKFDWLANSKIDDKELENPDDDIKVIAILLKANQTDTVDKEKNVKNETVESETSNKTKNQEFQDNVPENNSTIPMMTKPADRPLFVFKTTRISSRNHRNFHRMVQRLRNQRLRKFETKDHPNKLEKFLDGIKKKSS